MKPVQFFKLSGMYGVSLSLIQTRKVRRVKRSGCTAAAVICGDNGNVVKYLIAGSGGAPVAMIFPQKKAFQVPSIFTSFSCADSTGKTYSRDTDAEFKLLNVLAEILDRAGRNRAPDTWIALRIEQEPCDSCRQAIKNFRDRFKDVELEVKFGVDDVRSSLKEIAHAGLKFDIMDETLKLSRRFKPT
jgi:hypothetical protein